MSKPRPLITRSYDRSSLRPMPVRGVAALLAALLVGLVSLGAAQAVVGQNDKPKSAAAAREERRAIREQRTAAARELDAARADDAAVAEALAAITDAVNAQQASLDEARRQLATARSIAVEAEAQVVAADVERAELEALVGRLAVDGFLESSRSNAGNSLLSSADPNEALRRSSLLRLADSDTDDLLEQLRAVREDREIAEASARKAVEEAQRLEHEMAVLVAELESQRSVQAELKAELETRVAVWRGTLAGLEQEEQQLSEFIRQEEARMVPPRASAPVPGVTSGSGFQWPLNASVSSEYGYRVHPIFGTRRLHAGIDLGAGTGTPIVAAKGGTVISAGPHGGYGNAVVIAHGGGLSTLYAHMSKLGVSSGASVGRGEVIGYVGSTGQSTGPHLHFEVRENGSPTNPRRHLP